MTEFDYIVVGGGTAGCVLAARLSEDPDTSVLLVEAGSARLAPAMTVPDAWPELLGTAADWGDVTSAQADAGPLPYPRGRALGGSGAINAMAHIRGHRAVYDVWAAGGAPGWGYDDLLPCFWRSEHAEGRHPVLRGTGGQVRVAPVPERDPRHGRELLPPGRHLPDRSRRRCGRGGGRRAAGPRDQRAAGRRCLGVPAHPQRPPACHRAGHRGESRRPDRQPVAPARKPGQHPRQTPARSPRERVT